MFKKIPGNVQKDSEECSNRNVRKYSSESSKDSREYLKIFKETLLKISGNIRKNFGECLKVLQGMLSRNPGNVQEDSAESKFGFISWNFACFYQILPLNCYKRIEKKSLSKNMEYLHGKKNHFFGVPKSIVHVMKPVSFQLCRAHPDGVIWKNWHLTRNTETSEYDLFT